MRNTVTRTATIDPATEFYIHLRSNSFMNSANRAKINAYNRGSIADAYIENAEYVKSRYMKSRGYLNTLEDNKKYANEMNSILDLYASVNSGSMNSIFAKKIQSMSDDIVSQIKRATATGAIVKKVGMNDVKSDIDALKKYVSELNTLIKMIGDYDQVAITLAAESKGTSAQSIKQKGGLMANPDAAYLMTANKTGQTSLQNLARKTKELERVLGQMDGSSGKNISSEKVRYYDAAKGKERERTFSELLGGLPTQLTNIQGGIGEMMAAVVAEEGIKDGMLNMFKGSKDVRISLDTDSASEVVKNSLLGLSATSVSDTKITITPGADGGMSSTLSIGISSKAIFTKGTEAHKKSATTSFGKTNVAGLLARANLWEHEFQYLFFNLIAPHIGPNGQQVDLYKDSENLRRYIAARAMRRMLGGLEGEKGDTVYFLKYQDAMYPVEEYFYSMSNLATIGKAVPIANIADRKSVENNLVVSAKDPGLATLAAYVRSRIVRQKILSLSATVTKTM